MSFFASDTISIKLADATMSKTLWSTTDGLRAMQKLTDSILNSPKPLIDIDLRGLTDFDTYFIERVFVDIAKKIATEFAGSRALVFTLPINDDNLELRLSNVFRRHDSCVVFRRGNTLELSGAASFESKILWHKLVHYSPVVPEIVCSETGSNKEDFETELLQLRNSGAAIRVGSRFYTSVFRQRSPFAIIRYYLKFIKLMFTTKPLYLLMGRHKS